MVEKKVYYRRAQFTAKSAATLKSALAAALSSRRLLTARLEAIDTAASAFRVIGDSITDGAFLCGYLTSYERGRVQAVVLERPGATTLDLDTTPPPTGPDGLAQQFALAVLYFVVCENHVAIVQSAGLRANSLEEHFVWLLRESGQIGKQDGMVLRDETQKATLERIRKAHVTSLMIGKPLMEEQPVIQPAAKASITKFRPIGVGLDVVKSLMPRIEFDKLNLEERVFDGNLEVWIQLRYPKRQRSKPENAVRLLDDLAISLRNIDDGEVSLQLGDRTTVKGNELRVSGVVKCNELKGLPNRSELFDAMKVWLRRIISDGVVDPD